MRTLPTILRVPGSAMVAGLELLLASNGEADDCEFGNSLTTLSNGLCGPDEDATDD